MLILMEFNNHKSIFLQIAENITEKVVSGTYPPGEKIPSVRELAAEMGVNPNTIMRTYSELQASEIIDNKRGIGFFVNPEAKAKILEQKKQEFFGEALPELIRQANILGITAEHIISHLQDSSETNGEA